MKCLPPLCLVLITLAGGGCYEHVVYDSWDPMRDMSTEWHDPADPRQRDAEGGDGIAVDPFDWTILIKAFEGGDARQQAAALISELRRTSRTPGLMMKSAGNKAFVLRGKYRRGDTYEAKRDLQQTQMIVVGDQRPFEQVQMRRLSMLSDADPLDVRQYGDRWAYTLQVGVFNRDHDSAPARAAEQYARKLRSGGYEAFYYHGPGGKMSMVAVGLFSQDDLETVSVVLPNGREVFQTAYGPRVKALQQKLPYNRVNGEIYNELDSDGQPRPQPSMLVPIK